MNLYLVLVLVFVCLLYYLIKEKNRLKTINCTKSSDGSGKYISKGLGFILEHFLYILLESRSNKLSSDTAFDTIYRRFGSPNSKNSKAIYIIKILNQTVVYAKDYATIKRLLTHNCCSDRAPKAGSEIYCGGDLKGITFNDTDASKELRRYTMKTLGQLGFGKNQMMDDCLNELLTDLLTDLENFRRSTGNKIQVQDLFVTSAINVIWHFVGSEKYNRDSKELHLVHDNISTVLNINLLDAFFSIFLPRKMLRYTKLSKSLKALHEFFFDYVENRKMRGNKDKPIDYIDYFFVEISKYQNDTEFNKIYNEYQLAGVLMDLFTAGIDTTASYMECTFMYMALNPKSQIKMQREIDLVIGDSIPSYEDHRQKMIYTQATLMEIHRMANIFTAMVRMVSKDCVIDDQHFKKGTGICLNWFYYRKDETYWGDPQVFRPERFLDFENNLIMEKMNHVLPFGAGSRRCIGENVASSIIFTLFTGILQKYSIAQSDPTEHLRLANDFAITSRPNPFHVKLIPRIDF